MCDWRLDSHAIAAGYRQRKDAQIGMTLSEDARKSIGSAEESNKSQNRSDAQMKPSESRGGCTIVRAHDRAAAGANAEADVALHTEDGDRTQKPTAAATASSANQPCGGRIDGHAGTGAAMVPPAREAAFLKAQERAGEHDRSVGERYHYT